MTMVTRWNPFREFDDFVRAELVPAAARERATWTPAVDIVETDADFQLLLEIPAVAPQDVKVAVEENVLTVSGERQLAGSDVAACADDAGSAVNAEVKHHRRERHSGPFSRSFRLPDTVDEESINASAKDGVLTLSIAKRAQPQPRQIEVKVH